MELVSYYPSGTYTFKEAQMVLENMQTPSYMEQKPLSKYEPHSIISHLPKTA
jgi:hypothetical protein